MSPGEFSHELRVEARHLLLQRAGARRADMAGLGQGIDIEATTRLLRKGGNDAVHKGMLRSVLCGSIVTGQRSFKFLHSATNWCEYCDSLTVESVHHMFWECTAWQSIRDKHLLASGAWRPDWPTCFAC